MVAVGWADWKVLGVTVITLSLILSGIFIGLGRAFGNRKFEMFGIEELLQSIINAGILGAVAVLEATISSIGSGFFIEKKCGSGGIAAEWVSCMLTNISNSVFSLLQGLVKTLSTVGYYQQLTLDFSAFSIQPLANLSSISAMLGSQAETAQLLLMLLNLNLQIIDFIIKSGFPLLFAAGLVFRAFFATRRLGGFLIALALGFFLFYPTIILMFPDPSPEIGIAAARMGNFTNSSVYAPWPILDLNGNDAIAQKLDSMSGWGANATADMSGDLTIITRTNANALSGVLMYAVIAPLFALLVTIVFIKELGDILGAEMTIPFKAI